MILPTTKAILSFTSYPERIFAFEKTILKFFNFENFSNNFHVVLNLYKDEFINIELPTKIVELINKKYLEVLWHEKNYLVFMKILFTMDKYKEFPVISADDDNYPVFNWPEYLYLKYKETNADFVSFWGNKYKNTYHLGGNFTISKPYIFDKYGILYLTNDIIDLKEDDPYYTILRVKMNLTNCFVINQFKISDIIQVHDEIRPLHDIYLNRPKKYALIKIEEIFDKNNFIFANK